MERHPLSLKVMRLTRPSLTQRFPTSTEPTDEIDDAIHSLQRGAAVDVPKLEDCALTNLLKLPSVSGPVYLGEMFSAFLCIRNDSEGPVSDVSLKVDFQTDGGRDLLVEPSQRQRLEPGQQLPQTISYDVRAIGVHVLSCVVFYTNSIGEQKSFPKYFKFKVVQPLDVHPTFTHLPKCILLEVRLRNMMQHPVHFQSVKFHPSPAFKHKDHTVYHLESDDPTAPPRPMSVFPQHTALQPKDARQYLYKLTPASGVVDLPFKMEAAVGKLDIVWRGMLGEPGTLQTSQLIRRVPKTSAFEADVTVDTTEVLVHKQFQCKCRIMNLTAVDLAVSLEIDQSTCEKQGIVVVGETSQNLGIIPAQGELPVDLQLLPVVSGITTLTGIRVQELQSGSQYPVVMPQMVVQPRTSSVYTASSNSVDSLLA
eukprot:m.123564 g.123564  ORF g.123564 m.123564 type:complete len:423 (+) comp13754_c0_seq17:111-1379(+)